MPLSRIAPELSILALSWFLGMQFVFVLRGMALKAAEEDVLERFVPQGLTQRIAHAGGFVPARVTPVTILVADIRGFTTMSEPLGPQQAVALLNDYFASVIGPLAAEEAVLDKYLGDGLQAFLEGPDHAARGLRAAYGIISAVAELNRRRAAEDGDGAGAWARGRGGDGATTADGSEGEVASTSALQHFSTSVPSLRIGVAVHTAEAFVGTIGAPVRMEYTIIGDAVNVTHRLEGLMSSKAGHERIDAVLVASADAVAAAAAGGLSIPALEGPVQVSVHGRQQPLDVYYLPAG
jgi:class 3 adenylate cyclase